MISGMTSQALPTVIERRRIKSPAPAPQALAFHNGALWMGSRDLGRIYGIHPDTANVFKEIEPPGIPWAAASTDKALWFTMGEGANDDRYIRFCDPDLGFSENPRVACPEFTGSYLSYDGKHLYLSQWYKHRILKLDADGGILRIYDIGAEISGHVFADSWIYVLRGTEQGNEDWRIARFDPQLPNPKIQDMARVPFQCRSLAFDATHFWANHRAADEIVCFDLPVRTHSESGPT
jgi:hypothetical protein